MEDQGRRLAVVIGIDQYDHGVPPLQNAVRDALALAVLLRELHGYEVQVFTDQEATADGLRAMLRGMAALVQPDDQVLFYFAGHGVAEEGLEGEDGPRGYFIPQDARRDTLDSFLPMAEVQHLLAPLPCRHLLVLLDCCFAGAFRWSRTRDVSVAHQKLYRERYERYLRDRAWQVLTSAAHDERALDVLAGRVIGARGEAKEHSPFAQAVLDGLRGAADFSDDGVIVAAELYLYLETAMQRLEEATGIPQQKPQLWSLRGRDKGQYLFHVPGRQPVLPSALELNETNNPYRGLSPYQEQDEGLFFGRAAVADELCARVQEQRLLVVSGASGTGKSSLVQAGLLPRLRRGQDQVWHILPALRPGRDPMGALAQVSRDLGGGMLGEAAVAFGKAHPGRKLLLVIDQLEELVTMGPGKPEREQFLQYLLSAVRQGGALHVVLTLRSDFGLHFGTLLKGGAGRFFVPPMGRAELREAIEGPAAERVLYFEPPGLMERLLSEVAEMPGALPLLSFILSEMYRALLRHGGVDRQLTEADYVALGEVAGALSQRADEIFEGLDAAQRATARRVLLRMVSLEAGEAARRRVPLAELEYADRDEQARVEEVLRRLLEARLLVSGEDRQGERYVEPAHDKLVLDWRLLWEFVQAEQDHLPLHRRLTQATVEWQLEGRPGWRLWDGDARLPQLHAAQQMTPHRFNGLEAEFLRHSHARRRNQRITLATITLAVFSILSGFAYYANDKRLDAERQGRLAEQRRLAEAEQRRLAEDRQNEADNERGIADNRRQDADRQRKLAEERRQETERQRQIADSQRQEARHRLTRLYVEQGRQESLKGNLMRAIVYLKEAYQDQEGIGATGRYLLATAAQQTIDVKRVIGDGSAGLARDAKFSPDSMRIVSIGFSALLWDANSGKSIAELTDDPNTISSAVFSPDGTRIVTTRWSPITRLWDGRSGRFLATLVSHSAPVSSVVFSPDGTRFVTASDDKTACLWDSQTGELLTILGGHTGRVFHAVFSPDGARVATASEDKTARLWDGGNGKPLATLKGHFEAISATVFSPDGTYIVTASKDKTARLWEGRTGKPLATLEGHSEAVWSAVFSPDGARVVTASKDKTARLWEGRTGKPLATLKGHSEAVAFAIFSPDGARVVTTSEDKTARLWDGKSGKPLATLKGLCEPARPAAFSPDGARILTLSEDAARLWDGETGKPLATLEGHNGHVSSAAFSPNGAHVVTTGLDGRMRLWDGKAGKLLVIMKGHSDSVLSAAFSPTGRRVVTASIDKTARFWDAKTGKLLVTLEGHTGPIISAGFSPDGTRIITASLADPARLWDGRSGKPLVTLQHHSGHLWSAKLSPDGTTIATASLDGKVRIWDSETAKLLAAMESNTFMTRIAFSPNGARVATGGIGKTARIWDSKTGRLLAILEGHSYDIESMVFSPDGARIVTTGDYTRARLWNGGTGRILTTLEGHSDYVRSATFSPDSTRVVTTSADKTARLWDGKTGKLLAILEGHSEDVTSADFSPDGARIITASADETARLWDGETGKLLATLEGHLGPVSSAVFSSDGARVATASKDGTARLWDVHLETRPVAEINRLVACYASFALVKEQVVPRTLNPDSSCFK